MSEHSSETDRGAEVHTRPGRRGDVIRPALLVGGGIVFLLNSTGRLEWDVWWSIARLWPVLLVAAGADLLFGRRSVLGSLLVVALIAAGFVGGVWLHRAGGVAQRALPVTEQLSQPLQGATAATVELSPAAGDLRVGSLDGSSNLIEGTLRGGKGERFVRSFAVDEGRAQFVLKSEGVGSWSPGVGIGAGAAPTWDLALAPDVPTALAVRMGVGTVALELDGLTIESVETNIGVGQVTLHLPSEGRMRAKISGAIGQMVVVLPEGLEARIEVHGGIAGRSVPDGFTRQGDFYVSPGFLGADNYVEMEVGMAIGNVQIRRGD